MYEYIFICQVVDRKHPDSVSDSHLIRIHTGVKAEAVK